jgi:predicted DNA-binding protein (MmcQ/YjbR family)
MAWWTVGDTPRLRTHGLGSDSVAVRALRPDPIKALQQALVKTDAGFSVAAYVGKHGWVNFDASGAVDWEVVRELVVESYCLNAPKRLARQAAP